MSKQNKLAEKRKRRARREERKRQAEVIRKKAAEERRKVDVMYRMLRAAAFVGGCMFLNGIDAKERVDAYVEELKAEEERANDDFEEEPEDPNKLPALCPHHRVYGSCAEDDVCNWAAGQGTPQGTLLGRTTPLASHPLPYLREAARTLKVRGAKITGIAGLRKAELLATIEEKAKEVAR